MNNLIKVEHFMWTAGNQKDVVGFWVVFFCFFNKWKLFINFL